jgi:hypothetical protein
MAALLLQRGQFVSKLVPLLLLLLLLQSVKMLRQLLVRS